MQKPRILPTEPQKTLTGKQRQAALLLASGKTIDTTAREVGVNEKTVDTWKKLPVFKDAMRQVEDDVYMAALSILKRAITPAITCLLRNMSEKVSAYVQVQAASKLLEQGLELHKMAEIERRIEELEEALGRRRAV